MQTFNWFCEAALLRFLVGLLVWRVLARLKHSLRLSIKHLYNIVFPAHIANQLLSVLTGELEVSNALLLNLLAILSLQFEGHICLLLNNSLVISSSEDAGPPLLQYDRVTLFVKLFPA
jgi:hypothetical protein